MNYESSTPPHTEVERRVLSVLTELVGELRGDGRELQRGVRRAGGRVRERGGSMKILDVIVEGVSMSVTQRSDFSSVIQRGGGNVDVLLDHLRK